MELKCSEGVEFATATGFACHLREVHGFDQGAADGLTILAVAGLNIAWDTAIWTDDHELVAIQIVLPY
jgi:hypothetical protein